MLDTVSLKSMVVDLALSEKIIGNPDIFPQPSPYTSYVFTTEARGWVFLGSLYDTPAVLRIRACPTNRDKRIVTNNA